METDWDPTCTGWTITITQKKTQEGHMNKHCSALLKSQGKLNISATLIHIKKKKYLCQIILGKHQVRFCAKARRKYKQFCNRNSSSDACQNMQLVQLEVVFISVFPSSCIQVIWCNIETEGCYHCTHGIVCTSKQHVRRKNTH